MYMNYEFNLLVHWSDVTDDDMIILAIAGRPVGDMALICGFWFFPRFWNEGLLLLSLILNKNFEIGLWSM